MIDHGLTIAGPRAKGLEGSRGLYLLWQLRHDLAALKPVAPRTVVVEGEASGIDAAARDFGEEYGFKIDKNKVTSEDWAKSRGAGYARNQEMVDKSPRVWTYWNGFSKGTRHTSTISFTVNKLERMVLWSGVIWERGMSRWHPLEYGAEMNASHDYYLSLALSERLRRNRTSPAMKNGPELNMLKLTYANARARDAFLWLSDWTNNRPVLIRVAETAAEEEYVGYYRFPSKGRKGKFHYTAPGATECSCEGWHPELVGKPAESRQWCSHLMIVWMWEYLYNKILPQFHPLELLPVEEQIEEMEYQHAA
jgi:hypothetical protein